MNPNSSLSARSLIKFAAETALMLPALTLLFLAFLRLNPLLPRLSQPVVSLLDLFHSSVSLASPTTSHLDIESSAVH